MRVLTMLALRRAIVPALTAATTVTALIPAARIYPEEPPVSPQWPFARVGEMTPTRFAPSGVRGASIAGTVHVFAKGPGMDAAVHAAAAVAEVLDAAVFDLSADMGAQAKATMQVTGAPVLRDQAEQGAWQVAVQYVATVEMAA